MPQPPFSPAAERNKGPILAHLQTWLPATGLVLEVAAGTGQHCCHFAAALPGLRFQPTEVDGDAVARLRQGLADAPVNVLPPVALDVTRQPWDLPEQPDTVYVANMLHIAPWAAAEGLFAGAADAVPVGGQLVVYGPFQRDGGHTAPSNAAFHADLQARNPAWGIRHLEAVEDLAAGAGWQLAEVEQMPANNLLLRWQRAAA